MTGIEARREYRIVLTRWDDLREGDVYRECGTNSRGEPLPWHIAISDGGTYDRPELGLTLVERQVEIVDPPPVMIGPADPQLFDLETRNDDRRSLAQFFRSMIGNPRAR